MVDGTVESIMRCELTALADKAAQLAQYYELANLSITAIPEDEPGKYYIRVSACDLEGSREVWTKSNGGDNNA